ncbi:MAG: hypothetical protein JXR48_12340 [Candidatus Delongbacteria bacterium]|nr:hypothetical protein [Candidatus Delongbacteria bacterium]MBN2835741.1 hypothetical protein [Candidatus Delongbacteria bacterium]
MENITLEEKNRRYSILINRRNTVAREHFNLLKRMVDDSFKWMNSSPFLQTFMKDPEVKYKKALDKIEEEIERLDKEIEMYE